MRRRFIAGVLVIVLAGSACGDEPASSGPGAAGGAPDRVVTGPQGDRGQFVVECGFDRFLADDPIVHPGQPNASHLHQFFGAVGVDAMSTHADLLPADTTCDQQADTASYWSPTLLDGDGEIVEPLVATAYYRAGPGVEPATVQPYPAGLTMVAGDHLADEPQPLSLVSWSCGTGANPAAAPPDCSAAGTLRMSVRFPDCWDGEQVSSPLTVKPSQHVGYSSAGECPGTHPVPIPQLELAIDYDAIDPDGAHLSSGSIYSGHADFWNGWNQDKLAREVDACIVRDLPCGIAESSSRTMGH